MAGERFQHLRHENVGHIMDPAPLLLVAGLTFRAARALVSLRVGFDLLFCGGLDRLAGALGDGFFWWGVGSTSAGRSGPINSRILARSLLSFLTCATAKLPRDARNASTAWPKVTASVEPLPLAHSCMACRRMYP